MAVEYLGSGNDDGVVLGRSASDLVAFHNATPVDQAGAIANIANDASGTVNATAVNGILAALREKGLIAT